MGRAMQVGLYLLLLSASFSLLDAAGVDDAFGVEFGVDLSEYSDAIGSEVRAERDLSSPSASVSIFYSGIQAAMVLLEAVIGVPTMLLQISMALVPGPFGVAIGTFLQVPADFLMGLELIAIWKGVRLS